MSKLHAHNRKLYEQVNKYIHDQSKENATALADWFKTEGVGLITGYYPTNFVHQSDVVIAVNDEEYTELNHNQMLALAIAIGMNDTSSGTFWTTITEFYYDITGR